VSTLNLGILAHVDAGKTSLTERLLHLAGVIDDVGSVDDGSTRTDFLDLERQRGITIKAAVVSFALGDLTVNLIDTPGHADFIAEVERVLRVLDGAVLVVSAVEGVQGQTRVLMRVLQRLGIPTLLFVNKIDRAGAREGGVLDELAERISPDVVPMGATRDLGSVSAAFEPWPLDDPALADRSREGLAHPVYFGSAITGAGVEALVAGIRDLLPHSRGACDGTPAGRVFKVERGPSGEKVALVRMTSGMLRVRDRVRLPSGEAKVTGLEVYDAGGTVTRHEVGAGRIARVRGLAGARVGDVLGAPGDAPLEHWFAPPTLETVVEPVREEDRRALHTALTDLAEQDPLIDLRQDDVRGELWVSMYGEVQKEVVAATLAADHGVEVTFRKTTTVCVERLVDAGEAFEIIAVAPNPFLATVGLRVAPAPVGAGVTIGLGVELGSMPSAFFNAIEETVHETLHQGLHGWDVPDCAVTITHTGYWPRQSHAHATFDASMSSTAGDFRNLTPLVLTEALQRAGTQVCEPMHRFDLEVPADRVGAALGVLARLRGVPHATDQHGATYVLSGVVPAAEVHRLQQQMPTLTRGEGGLTTEFGHYAPVRGPAPSRPRTDLNPLDRKEYLLRVGRRL
jgi:ribosomal protection tetracycline resistance protein